ncbi:MAG: hypothetical protein Q8930_02295 [Bacillota bacterium]|nr:hypothetical protein [Bacillota bacterium]
MRGIFQKRAVIILLVLIVLAGVSALVGFNLYNRYSFSKYYNLGLEAMDSEHFDEAEKYLDKSLEFDSSRQKDITSKVELSERLKKSKADYEQAEALFNGKNYLQAMDIYKQIPVIDERHYEEAQGKIVLCRNRYISENINMAESEADNGRYESAITYLDNVLKLDVVYEDALALKSQYNRALSKRAEEAREAAEQKDAADDNANSGRNTAGNTPQGSEGGR